MYVGMYVCRYVCNMYVCMYVCTPSFIIGPFFCHHRRLCRHIYCPVIIVAYVSSCHHRRPSSHDELILSVLSFSHRRGMSWSHPSCVVAVPRGLRKVKYTSEPGVFWSLPMAIRTWLT